MNWVKYVVLLAVAWMLASRAQAAELISVPEEELAKESVLPVFNKNVAVRARNIATEGRFDVNILYGYALSEPIHNVNRLGLSGYYHTNEDNAFGVLFAKNTRGLSSYANQLNGQFNLDFGRAPAPSQTLMGDWNWKMFYGKMSLSKDTVYNLSLYSTLGAGLVQYSHKSYPAIAPGLGQKFYLSKNLAIRFDFRLFMHQAPIPFLDKKGDPTAPGVGTGDRVPAPEDFQERLTFTTMLDAGVTWLF